MLVQLLRPHAYILHELNTRQFCHHRVPHKPPCVARRPLTAYLDRLSTFSLSLQSEQHQLYPEHGQLSSSFDRHIPRLFPAPENSTLTNFHFSIVVHIGLLLFLRQVSSCQHGRRSPNGPTRSFFMPVSLT